MLSALRSVQRRFNPDPELIRKLFHVGIGLFALSFPILIPNQITALILCAAPWSWSTVGDKTQIVLKPDGSGVHVNDGKVFQWDVNNWLVTLKFPTGETAVIQFDPARLTYKGPGFNGKDAVSGAMVSVK